MSESLSSELSYGEPLGNAAGSDTLSIPNEREATEATEVAEQLPDSESFDPEESSTVPDPQNDNRLSVVSAASLEPRRRTRHHSSRHSHMHRDLAHMLSVSARDAKELRRGLSAAYSKLDQSRERASHAEKLALDILIRVREAEEEREKAMREASAVHEELGRYKALLDSAHGEIRRGQSLLQDQEHLRYEAEAAAARARDNARQMKQRRLIELAREQGRKMGYDEGIQAGQRIGYHDGQSPGDSAKVNFDEAPRFREIFDGSNYRLDNFDQPPPGQPNPSSPNDPGVLPLAPQAIHPPYTDLQAQFDEIPAIPHNTTTPPSEGPYTSSLRGVLQPPSSDSSSTTTLPAAPIPLRALSRAPPTMPTIPEVASTEVGSSSRRSRSLRDSPRIHNYIQPAPQAPAHNVVLPSIQDPATFEPPPGSVGFSPLSPRASSYNDDLPSIVHPLQDRAAFEPPPGSVGVSPVLAPQVSPHDDFLPSIIPALQDRSAFEPPPGSVGMSPVLVPQASAYNTVLPSTVPTLQDRATFQPPPGSVYEPPSAPARGHQGPGEQPIYSAPSPRGGHRNFLNTNGVTSSERIRSPVQERFSSAPETTPSQVHGHYANTPRNAPSTVRENFPSASEYAPSQARERFPSTHSRRTSRSRAESIQLADELRSPDSEISPRVSSRPGGSAPRRDGPPKRRPIPQMPAPLAPQPAPNASYGQGPESGVRHRQPSEFDYGMPSNVGMNPSSSSRVIPGPAERQQTNRAPAQHSGAGSRQSYGGQHPVPSARDLQPGLSTDRDPQSGLSNVRDPQPGLSTVRDQHPGPSTGDQHPGLSTVRDHHLGPSTVHEPHTQAAPYFIPSEPPAGQQAAPQNRSPRVHVQIPPTRYYTPDLASRPANSPTAYGQVPPTYSPGAGPSSPNPNVSDSQLQSPSRFPPTLYNEPKLQQQSSRGADYQQEQATSPTLPVPSRNSRATSHVMIPPPSRRNSYATRQGMVTDTGSPRTPTDALPVPPPSLSPHPSPSAFPRQIPPSQGAATSSTLRRPTSPNPLPRSSSPAPLPRAASPAPLPIRSPSMRSANIHRSASDVSLPGAPGSPYMHYNPNLEANIAVLASAEKLAAPTW